VLSAFFWMLTLGAYAFYTERPGLCRYGTVLLFFVLGLIAKPMLVTLPFVFLLLDYWPLGRFPQLHPQEKKKVSESLKSLRPLLLEKIPFFLLSAASSVVTYVAQQRGGAVESFQSLPLSERLGNALVSYILYIGKMLWPQNLAVMYPHYGMPSLWQTGGAFLLLLGITGLVIGRARLRPYLMVGWLWYLGTLVPVIGIVQVGAQAMADRYTYLPLIGLFIMAAWGVSDLTVSRKYRKEILILLAGTVLSILMISTWFQLQHWKNSITLFENALQKTKNNAVAHSVLGIVLYKQGKVPEAVGHFQEAIRIDPAHSSSYNNLGLVLRNQGKIEEAIVYYQEAVRNNPRNTEALNNMGSALYALGRKQEAADYYIRVIHINPDHATAHYNLGNVFGSQGKITEAVAQFREAVRVKPDYAEAQNNLGYGLLLSGKPDEAIEPLRKVLEIQPDSVLARRNLNEALARQKELR
jgi:tetratricopeptide (TPR) repeat protein